MADGRGSIPQRTIRNRKTIEVHQITKDNYLSFMETYGSQIGGSIQYRGSGIEIRMRNSKGGTMPVQFGDWVAIDDKDRDTYYFGPHGRWEEVSVGQSRSRDLHLVEQVARLMYERTWGNPTANPAWSQAGHHARDYWRSLAAEAVESVYDMAGRDSHGTNASQA